jgi:uncharacterized integral membrane protein (TIGR00698 family)
MYVSAVSKGAAPRHAPTHHSAAESRWRHAARIAPGLLLAMALAGAAFALHCLPGIGSFSPMIISILLGIGFHNLIGTPARARAGVVFSLKRLLRLAIILLGLQLTVKQIATVGLAGLAVVAASLVATFVVTIWAARLTGVEPKLATLIAAGTSICGASAVVATNVVTEAPDEDVAYAVACVTVFGSIAMFLYPALPTLLHLGPKAYGLWAGASIHEIAQVVAAAFQAGPEAGHDATIAKLTRVTLLAPTVIALGLLVTRRRGAPGARWRPPVPYFVLGFVALVIANSLVTIPAANMHWIVLGTTFLLSLALAAMGLETDIRKLRAKGLRPLLLGAISWLFIAGFSLILVVVTS